MRYKECESEEGIIAYIMSWDESHDQIEIWWTLLHDDEVNRFPPASRWSHQIITEGNACSFDIYVALCYDPTLVFGLPDGSIQSMPLQQ